MAEKNNRSSATDKNTGNEKLNVEVVEKSGDQRVDILVGGEPFTSYLYSDSFKKPVLYPLTGADGTIVTRGFPIEPRPGERTDHPHHLGMWFNYGDVNGLDFWNNSDEIQADEKKNYGTIHHTEILRTTDGTGKGELEVTMEWTGPEGETLLKENTTFVFSGTKNERTVERITTLEALDEKITMHDNKEGLLGIRMARQLELPSSDQPSEVFTDSSGRETEVPAMSNESASGMYRSSEGVEGLQVWGTRAKWMKLSGRINNKPVSVVIFDHPDNPGYPTYWHARGYGLFAANPLGQEALSGGEEELNFELEPGESVTFKYRVVIYSGGNNTDQTVNDDWEEFSNSESP